MRKAVIDTNILISAAISPSGNPAKIVNMALDKIIQIYLSAGILAEYEEVLSRPEFNFSSEKQNAFLLGIKKSGIIIEPSVSDTPLPDESDRIFYDTAKASGAILISGNLKHYPAESFIMTPSSFLTSYEKLIVRDSS